MELVDDPTFGAGKWYMFAAPDFFTMIGKYVRPLGFGLHRFEHVIYMVNGNGQTLPDTCRKGPAEGATYTAPFPGPWSGAVKWSTPYLGPTPWVQS